jgi:hypothetical protein
MQILLIVICGHPCAKAEEERRRAEQQEGARFKLEEQVGQLNEDCDWSGLTAPKWYRVSGIGYTFFWFGLERSSRRASIRYQTRHRL